MTMFFAKNYLQNEIPKMDKMVYEVNKGQHDTLFYDILIANGNIEKGTSEFFSWRTNSIGELPDGICDGVNEGAEFAKGTLKNNRKVIGNTQQIFTHPIEITGTANAQNPMGVKSQLAEGLAEGMVFMKKAINKQLMLGTESQDEPRKMKGALNFTETVLDLEQGEITDTTIEDAMEKLWLTGNHGDKLCFVNSTVKKAINKVYKEAVNHTVEIQMGHTKVGVLVDTIMTDYGNVHLILDRNMPARQAFICDPSVFIIVPLRPMQILTPDTNADTIKKVLLTEVSLKCKNPGANVKILNIGKQE